MNNIKEKNTLENFFEKIYFYIENEGNPNNWKEYLEIFKSNSIKIRKLAAEFLEEKQILWVLGI